MNKAAIIACLGWAVCSLPASGGGVYPIVTDSASVVFSETGTATLSIKPACPLSPGERSNRQIALASASTTGGVVAYRWLPMGATSFNGVSQSRALTGKASADNKLTVSAISDAVEAADYPGWYTAPGRANTLNIVVIALPDERPVVADSYVISLDAAVWNE